MLDGGDIVSEVLKKHGVKFLFTLCGGHISPILVHSKKKGIKIIDCRHEANAVFAADAVSRISGVPGVAAVTAGPGVTNTITAIKNAQMAQSPLILLGGASATILRGRGSLQDIDQISVIKSCVKACFQITKVKDISITLTEAFKTAKEGIPGPVFVELPIDTLYPEQLVRSWYGTKKEKSKSFADKAINWYINRHLNKLFQNASDIVIPEPARINNLNISYEFITKVKELLKNSSKPVILAGSQLMNNPQNASQISESLKKIGVPVYLSGMGRGALGKESEVQFRHNRKNALKEADLVILAGVVCDFRLDYGSHISKKAKLVSVNLSAKDLNKNRKADLSSVGDPGAFIQELAKYFSATDINLTEWFDNLKSRENKRNEEIQEQSEESTDKYINPLFICKNIEEKMSDNSIIVADGGDFVATASYILKPRQPLSWLDPGVYGTLGVGAGFALGAKLCRPDAEVWIIYGDGSAGYSIMETDTFKRHGLGIISVVGNDACWSQIARDQVEILKDDAGLILDYSDYHMVSKGLGGDGILIKEPDEIENALNLAKESAKNGIPFLINSYIGKTDFRKGSISV
jgi:thiamine pyrophosphate-dependent acetolactate synthase large subunit-like protein